MSDQGAGRPEGPAPGQTASGVRHGGTVVGVVLVVLGIVMLFGRYVPWSDVLRLWPLLIVIGGTVQIFRPNNEQPLKRVAEGVGSIVVGLVLLGNTFGYLPWTVWVTMLSLWPLLLVALGIELLGKGLGLVWVRALSNVVLILGLLYGAFVLQPGTVGFGWAVPGVRVTGVPYSADTPHDSAVREGTAIVRAGAARLAIEAGTSLVHMSGVAPSDSAPELNATVTSGVAEVSVDEPSRRTVVLGVHDRTMELTLDGAVTWKRLQLDVGAVEGDADLRGLRVESVVVNVGASDLSLTLGRRSDDVKVDISGGAANVTLRVPADATVSLNSKSGLSMVNTPAGFRRLSGMPVLGESTWVSEGSGGPSITVNVQSGVSNLDVETY